MRCFAGYGAEWQQKYALMRIVRISIYAYNERAWPGFGTTGHGVKQPTEAQSQHKTHQKP
jgi:hypothetical protein